MPTPFPTDHDIMAELVSETAAELGVHRGEIYIVDGDAILYHPTIEVSVGFTRGGDATHQAENDDGGGGGDGGDGDGAAAAALSSSTVEVTLPTEHGPTGDEVAPATVRHARDLIAAAVGIVPASAAVLSVTGGGGDLADLNATLEAAGIVQGAELTVRRSVVE
jgi:hypothetical protein